AGLTMASEKVQKTSPWKYLGWQIGMHSFSAQPLQISTEIETLHDAQKLLGTINLVLPLLGISNADLEPLFALLRGEPDLLSPSHLNKEAQIALQKVADAISQRQSTHWVPELPLWLIVLNPSKQPHALIFQWDSEKVDPLLIIKWVFLPNNMPKTIPMQDELMAMLIIKAHQRLTSLAGKDFDCIFLPLTMFYLNWLLQMSEKLQIALADNPRQISIHPPKHKLLNSSFNLLPKPKRSQTPLRAMTIFTDVIYGSGKTHKSVIVWKDSETGTWQSDIAVVEGSPQIVELAAVVRVFQKFSTPFNLVTDST
ncbi:POK10 protein, partial [Sylvia atricapilla]|nr:POK10 protein [Sylvia atricapilla]